MYKLDNKGFTLAEVLAVVVILSILIAILVPNVNTLLNKGQENSYSDLKNSILVAAKEYVNDNRYNIKVSDTTVESIGSESGNQITVKTLLDGGYLSASGTDSSGEYIVNPKDRTKKLNLGSSYVIVSFDSSKKDYTFGDVTLVWQ
jgi:prepilin-type N-terminal cleavage/methylation domain-containing protein